VYEVFILLGCDAVLLDVWLLMLPKSMDFLTLEDGISMFSQNIGSQVPIDAASYPRRVDT
jgi:hypothetical protein